MKLSTIILLFVVLLSACSSKDKKVPLIKNIFLLHQGSDETVGYGVAQQVNENFLNQLVKDEAVEVYSNPLNVFVKALSAKKDTTFYSIRIKNDTLKAATVVELTRTRFAEQINAECAECAHITLKQDAATKLWTISPVTTK
jgi:regulator of protease activity HflC (stomatin/prohibitin superfamily)